MFPKNIQEYIVEGIIKHIKYRDDEVKKLYEILEDFGITKCDNCSQYTKDGRLCDMCDLHFCETCYDLKIKHVNTWNLSGSNMCDKCITVYCHFCIGKVGPAGRKCATCNSLLCETCTNRWRECCKSPLL